MVHDDTAEMMQEALVHCSPVVEEPNTETIIPTKKLKGLGAVLEHIADDVPSLVKASSSLSTTEHVKHQVKEYCDEAVMPTGTDALQWWIQRQSPPCIGPPS